MWMNSSLETPEAPDQAQTCVNRADTPLLTTLKQSLLAGDKQGDDKPSYTIWVRRVTPSGHPYLLANENDYDIDDKEDSKIELDDYAFNQKDDPVEDIETSLLKAWYLKLLCMLEATAIICYPVTLRGCRVIAAKDNCHYSRRECSTRLSSRSDHHLRPLLQCGYMPHFDG